jgi:hypothetical protein
LGHNTYEALEAWRYKRANNGRPENVPRDAKLIYQPPSATDLPRQHEVAEFYGQAGPSMEERLAYATVPGGLLRLDYALATEITRMRVHEKCAPHLEQAILTVVEHYGAERMRELGIDRYAGGYLHRNMRGSSDLSMHAYGCATDWFAAPNGLRMRCPKALFCGKEYKDFLDIMEAHGWLPAIRLWGADAMHFQMVRM